MFTPQSPPSMALFLLHFGFSLSFSLVFARGKQLSQVIAIVAVPRTIEGTWAVINWKCQASRRSRLSTCYQVQICSHLSGMAVNQAETIFPFMICRRQRAVKHEKETKAVKRRLSTVVVVGAGWHATCCKPTISCFYDFLLPHYVPSLD